MGWDAFFIGGQAIGQADRADTDLGLSSITLLAIFVTGFVVALRLNYDIGRRFRENRLPYHTVQRGASIVMIILLPGSSSCSASST